MQVFYTFLNKNITYIAAVLLQVWNIACILKIGIQKFIFHIYVILFRNKFAFYRRVAIRAQRTSNYFYLDSAVNIL